MERTLSLPRDMRPMEAESVEELPRGESWLYEPKYDGFRCLAYKDASGVRLQSRNQKPLARYFPELAEGLEEFRQTGFVLDGEIIIPGESFDLLQLRLHPAASRVRKLAAEHPSCLVAFDLLAEAESGTLTKQPFAQRRTALEAFVKGLGEQPWVILSDATASRDAALRWLGRSGLDGIVAKRLDLPYRPGERVMQKFKLWKTIDCVVGGLYRKRGSDLVESLLLGLYGTDGKLHYVGRAPVGAEAEEITRRLAPLVGGSGFTGRAAGGKSRWSNRERKAVPLKPVLVAEVAADHITGERMRHSARLLRWREDKDPRDCTMDQLKQAQSKSFQRTE